MVFLKPDYEKKTKMILNDNPMWKGIIALSIPVFLVNILKTLHDVVDGIFLGQVPDVDGVSISTSMQSAVALTWPIFFIFISFGIGLSVAGNALIGQYVGNNDKFNAAKYASNTIILSVFLGVVFTTVLFIFTPNILSLMGATGLELDYAITYLRIRSFELPFLFLSFGFQAVRQSTGDTVTPVSISAISICINIILTPILIFGFNMGIRGAAISTLIANILMTPFILYYFIKPKNGIKVILKKEIFSMKIIKDIFRIAIPASTGQAIQALGFVILNSMIYSFGKEVSAAFYIGNRINSLIMFPVSAISSIVAIYIAQNVGAGNIPRAKQAFKTGMFLGVTLMGIGALFIVPFRFMLVGLFNHDPATVALAAEYTLYLHIGLPLMGIFQTYLATFQGSGDTKKAFVMAVIRLWIFRLPLVLLSMKYTQLGPAGIWYSILVSNVIMVFVGMFLYSKMEFRPKIREMNPEKQEVLV
ncbi:MAG: MATE family efflux transporter [Firmicutes bacterium]|nr:MATE family efflux transporter [Bacillota bacterium]